MVAECQKRHKNDREKHQFESLPDSETELLGHIDPHHDKNGKINYRNKEKWEVPSRIVTDFQHDIGIVDRNKERLAGKPAFVKIFPPLAIIRIVSASPKNNNNNTIVPTVL